MAVKQKSANRPARKRRRKTAPGPGPVLAPLVQTIGEAIEYELHQDPFQRDPAFVRGILPLVQSINLYFGTEIRGWKNVPPRLAGGRAPASDADAVERGARATFCASWCAAW